MPEMMLRDILTVSKLGQQGLRKLRSCKALQRPSQRLHCRSSELISADRSLCLLDAASLMSSSGVQVKLLAQTLAAYHPTCSKSGIMMPMPTWAASLSHLGAPGGSGGAAGCARLGSRTNGRHESTTA